MIAQGTFARIHETDANCLIKKYKEPLAVNHLPRLEMLAQAGRYVAADPSRSLRHICFPRDVIRSDDGRITGVVIPRAPEAFFDEHGQPRHIDALMGTVEHPFGVRLLAARQLAAILEYLRKRGLVHGDIAPQNILVAESGDVFLLDCDGLDGGDNSCGIRRPGSMGWRDPRAQNFRAMPDDPPMKALISDHDLDSDAYALGLTVYRLICRSIAIAPGVDGAPAPTGTRSASETLLRLMARDPRNASGRRPMPSDWKSALDVDRQDADRSRRLEGWGRSIHQQIVEAKNNPDLASAPAAKGDSDAISARDRDDILSKLKLAIPDAGTVVNPPISNPPISNPPISNPPISNPPISNPPTIDPPIQPSPLRDSPPGTKRMGKRILVLVLLVSAVGFGVQDPRTISNVWGQLQLAVTSPEGLREVDRILGSNHDHSCLKESRTTVCRARGRAYAIIYPEKRGDVPATYRLYRDYLLGEQGGERRWSCSNGRSWVRARRGRFVIITNDDLEQTYLVTSANRTKRVFVSSADGATKASADELCAWWAS